MDGISNEDAKYIKFYQPNDFYWGIGIENETYLMYHDQVARTGRYIKKHRRRERYSIDYNTNYNYKKLHEYINTIFLDEDKYKIPQYLNSHTLSKTDIAGEHCTLYIVGKTDNPKYSGQTIHDAMMDFDEMFVYDYKHKYVFDGDTIEFITQNFYKTTVNNCVSELVNYKQIFLNKTNDFMKLKNLPELVFPTTNYGLVQHKTNPNNVNMFNNGTYHINITIPTQLDENCKIKDITLFENQHRNSIRLLAWFEPLIISLYGSPDLFSYRDNQKYSAGSLRLTASRYIGIGTYDTRKMTHGKQLNDPITSIDMCKMEKSWYNQIYQKTYYTKGEKIGYDVNYAKHYNSGIEFRIFDYFPEDALPDLMNLIVLLLDHSLCHEINAEAMDHQGWHDFVTNALSEGYTAKIPYEYVLMMHQKIGFPLVNESNVIEYLREIVNYLYTTYQKNTCSINMSPNMNIPRLHNINRFMWENNFLQYVPINNKNHVRVNDLYNVYIKMTMKDSNYASDGTDRIQNLLMSTGLHLINDLDLDSFYAKLLEICDKKLELSKYVLLV